MPKNTKTLKLIGYKLKISKEKLEDIFENGIKEPLFENDDPVTESEMEHVIRELESVKECLEAETLEDTKNNNEYNKIISGLLSLVCEMTSDMNEFVEAINMNISKKGIKLLKKQNLLSKEELDAISSLTK